MARWITALRLRVVCGVAGDASVVHGPADAAFEGAPAEMMVNSHARDGRWPEWTSMPMGAPWSMAVVRRPTSTPAFVNRWATAVRGSRSPRLRCPSWWPSTQANAFGVTAPGFTDQGPKWIGELLEPAHQLLHGDIPVHIGPGAKRCRADGPGDAGAVCGQDDVNDPAQGVFGGQADVQSRAAQGLPVTHSASAAGSAARRRVPVWRGSRRRTGTFDLSSGAVRSVSPCL